MSLPPWTFFACARMTRRLALLVGAAACAHASPVITVLSPSTPTSTASPIFYAAYATSPDCAFGIDSMRIYSADFVKAFTVRGAHIETFIKLSPGTYRTVLQAWDNCGAVGRATVNLTATSSPGVTVFSPGTSSAAWPVHVAASAQSPACSAGIAAMRVYVADGVSPYTVNSNQLDAYINLVPGIHKLTVQAWDRCGHVYKSQFHETVTATPDAYLYAVNFPDRKIHQFNLDANGVLHNPNGSGDLPEFRTGSGAHSLAIDPGGWFLYASTMENIYGFQIDRGNGRLVPMKGSPFPLNGKTNNVRPSVTVDPSGNFLVVRYGFAVGSLTTYRIDRSSGALTSTGFSASLSWHVTALDFSGQYAYAIDFGPSIDGWRLNPQNGSLVPLQSSPFFYSADIFNPSMCTTGTHVYIGSFLGSGGGAIYGFNIGYSTGALTELPDSPFSASSPDSPIAAVLCDWRNRFMWASYPAPSSGIQAFNIVSSGGTLTASPWVASLPGFTLDSWGEDHSGKYVFTAYSPSDSTSGLSPAIGSWPIAINGDLLDQRKFPISSPTISLAVARQDPI
jgi:hypothetical protein